MAKTEDIVAATKSYEAWLRGKMKLVPADLVLKHQAMKKDAFSFLRATYYRWASLWPELCPDEAKAPKLLAVGDLHVENFGTWRDAESRLVWGINDFDEAHHVAYTNDLVRLAASAFVAIKDGALNLDAGEACAALLQGYGEAIAAREARAFVLEEANGVLRDLAMGKSRSPKKFWKKLRAVRASAPPKHVRDLLAAHLPSGAVDVRYVRRVAGEGSLGIPRYAAVATSFGSLVAREAKGRAPPAFGWASGTDASVNNEAEIVAHAVRAPDPFLHFAPGWTVRRLAPHCERIALDDIAAVREARDVMIAMGRETANVHRGGPLDAIRRDIRRRKKDWLHKSAEAMTVAVLADWKAWRRSA